MVKVFLHRSPQKWQVSTQIVKPVPFYLSNVKYVVVIKQFVLHIKKKISKVLDLKCFIVKNKLKNNPIIKILSMIKIENKMMIKLFKIHLKEKVLINDLVILIIHCKLFVRIYYIIFYRKLLHIFQKVICLYFIGTLIQLSILKFYIKIQALC
jgi:hypothetical protein